MTPRRAAIVTGGGNGIGRATAEHLATSGIAVAVLDREEDSARRVAGALPDGIALSLDISDSAACRDAVEEVVGTFGRLDYLVNCAGSFIAAGLEATDEQWDAILGVNVRGGATMVAAATPHLRDAGRGAVVNVGSISGHVAQPGRWTYNATKGAISAITRCQALDLAPYGIRVNAVAPGWIWTREVEKAAGGDRARWEPVWGNYAMLRRLGEPVEVARAIAFLLSDAASFITGTELAVDGGYLALGPEGIGETAVFAGSE